MTPAITLFAALTVTLAASLVLFVANVRYVARNASSSFPPWAAIPVVTPVTAWRLGARGLPIAFGASVAFYVLLRIAAHVGGT